jgi:AcrR family transcriptional regulator
MRPRHKNQHACLFFGYAAPVAGPTPLLEPQQQRSARTRRRLLDAAVAELLENGLGAVTTVSVARRAVATRGAQQHHFPDKETLLAEAVRHLCRRHTEELERRLAALPRGRRRTTDALDLVYETFCGPVFAAMLELSLAARHEPALAEIVAAEEAAMAATFHDVGRDVAGPDAPPTPEFAATWLAAVSTIRGLAVLRILGHPERAVARQWRFARAQIIEHLGALRDARPPA